MPQIQAFVGAASIQPVPQMRAQVRMILLGLPRPTGHLPSDRGTVHPDTTGDLRLTGPLLVQRLDLDPVIERQMSVMCGQGSATPHDVY